MTVLEATHVLFSWFREHDSFEVDKNFKDLVPITEDKEKDEVCIVAALEKLQESELVVQKEAGERKIWLLGRPLESFEQNIEIGGDLAAQIAGCINGFCDQIGDNTDYVDPSMIQQKDIRNLVLLYSANMANEDQEEKGLT